MTNGDQILRGYAILRALKKNIPQDYEVSENWVTEFH